MASVTPGPMTRNKREEHPSPAYDSPMADVIRGANGKRVGLRNTSMFDPVFACVQTFNLGRCSTHVLHTFLYFFE